MAGHRRTHQFDVSVGSGVDAAVRLVTDRSGLVEYAIALRVFENGWWQTVRLYDNAHGANDMHRYSRQEGKRPAENFSQGRPSEAYLLARNLILEGWEQMIDSWRR